jgi:hypothetical protein
MHSKFRMDSIPIRWRFHIILIAMALMDSEFHKFWKETCFPTASRLLLSLK